MRVEWQKDFPQHVREWIEPAINRCLVLLPTWVHELEIEWGSESSSAATLSVQHDYRKLNLTVRGGALWKSAEMVVCHEFAHAYTTPMKYQAQQTMFEKLGEDSQEYKTLSRVLNETCEQMTCDLGHTFEKLLTPQTETR